MRARRHTFACLFALLALPAAARGDAASVVLHEERGPLRVTLMAAPVPLRVGPVELGVLVQSRATGAPLLDTSATLRILGPGTDAPLEVRALPGQGGNRLFQGARLELAPAGTWEVELLVSRAAGAEERFHTRFELASARGPARRYWAFIAAGPAGLALLALHQVLALARRRPPGTRRTTPSTPRGRPRGPSTAP